MESSISDLWEPLLLRARQGSRSALNRLMATHRPWLRKRVRGRLPRELERKVDASDLVQEIQYQAAVQFATFHGESLGEFRAWLLGITKWRVIRELRFWRQERRDPRREEPLSPPWSDQDVRAGSTSSILEQVAHQEECVRLMLAASWCREEDLAVIIKHLWEGRSHEEIAAELGVAPAAARQRFCRAVRRVRAATSLLEFLTARGLGTLQQDVIGLYRCRRADARQIAQRLLVPEELVARWIAEARPWFRAMAHDES